jgi:hypothetical protein
VGWQHSIVRAADRVSALSISIEAVDILTQAKKLEWATGQPEFREFIRIDFIPMLISHLSDRRLNA